MQARQPSFPAILGFLAVVAGVAACLTVVFLGMRAVMDIGGACASGGPYVPARPCPAGVAGMLIGGLWVGVILAITYAVLASRYGIPSLVGLLWPALFLSLGWNFLEYSFDPPFGDGLEFGWLIPGILFVLMGGIPLLLWISAVRARGVTPSAARIPMSLQPLAGIPRRFILPAPASPVAGPAAAELVAALERLDALHRSGALTDSEYKAAKRRAIAGES